MCKGTYADRDTYLMSGGFLGGLFYNIKLKSNFKNQGQGFLSGTVVKNLLANAGDTGSGPGPGRSHMPRST